MGKVIREFMTGFPGAVSRSLDNVIISMRNDEDVPIPFGAPVFQAAGENACRLFNAETSTQTAFLGFAVRAADKAPDVYGESEAAFAPNDPVDVLVRGSTVLTFANNANPGSNVYIRKSDGSIVTSPGAEGTTLQLPNVTVRSTRDSQNRAEVVLKNRNLL